MIIWLLTLVSVGTVAAVFLGFVARGHVKTEPVWGTLADDQIASVATGPQARSENTTQTRRRRSDRGSQRAFRVSQRDVGRQHLLLGGGMLEPLVSPSSEHF